MRGERTLIPARFVTLLGHLCVLIALLWESKWSESHSPANPYRYSPFRSITPHRYTSGITAAIALVVVELFSFVFGLTMFSPTVSLISVGAHSTAVIVLAAILVGEWLWQWFWPIFLLCSVLPASVDAATAVYTLFTSKW